MSEMSVNLSTLFLGFPKWLTVLSVHLVTALLEGEEREMKGCGQTGYQTQGLALESDVLPTALHSLALQSKAQFTSKLQLR